MNMCMINSLHNMPWCSNTSNKPAFTHKYDWCDLQDETFYKYSVTKIFLFHNLQADIQLELRVYVIYRL